MPGGMAMTGTFAFSLPAGARAARADAPPARADRLIWYQGVPSAHARRIEILGHVMDLAGGSLLYQNHQIGALRDQIIPALELGQYFLGLTLSGHARAFCSWAWVSDETRRRIVEEGHDRLSPKSWKEGPHLYVAEFIALDRSIRALVRQMRRHLGRGVPALGVRIRTHANSAGRIQQSKKTCLYRNVAFDENRPVGGHVTARSSAFEPAAPEVKEMSNVT